MPDVMVCTLSHSPLVERVVPRAEVVSRVETAVDEVRRRVDEFRPEVAVIFGPDHFNGFVYRLMPPFCVGMRASSIGDFDTGGGALDVDRALAVAIAEEALRSEVDVAVSEDMAVDHGFAQSLEMLFGGLDVVPVVPVFINCAAPPLGPARRARLLGAAVGRAVGRLDRRVLVVGSGGLSHDPPVPRLSAAPPEVVERLVAGRDPRHRVEHEARVVAAGHAFAAGESDMQDLNPDWDSMFLDVLEQGRLHEVDSWTTAWVEQQAGHSAHEVRTWIAAYAALAELGPYDVVQRFYEPVREWIAGFGTSVAIPG
jgi:2,3-dihydroxyphenylpropionate 1,2-dioxygenase